MERFSLLNWSTLYFLFLCLRCRRTHPTVTADALFFLLLFVFHADICARLRFPSGKSAIRLETLAHSAECLNLRSIIFGKLMYGQK